MYHSFPPLVFPLYLPRSEVEMVHCKLSTLEFHRIIYRNMGYMNASIAKAMFCEDFEEWNLNCSP